MAHQDEIFLNKTHAKAFIFTAAVIKRGMRPCTSASPPGLAAAENRHRHSTHTTRNTEHARVNQNTLCFMKKTLSPARLVLEDTSHQTRPKIDAGDASLLLGSTN
jgi:hypothetical protein